MAALLAMPLQLLADLSKPPGEESLSQYDFGRFAVFEILHTQQQDGSTAGDAAAAAGSRQQATR
jgi:hypothetical protein